MRLCLIFSLSLCLAQGERRVCRPQHAVLSFDEIGMKRNLHLCNAVSSTSFCIGRIFLYNMFNIVKQKRQMCKKL